MTLAALGCNPEETLAKDKWEDKGLPPLGTLAYSPGKGMFIACQADGAIAAGDLVQIEAGYQIDQMTTSSAAGVQGGVAPVAMVDDAYGWVQVFGDAMVRATAAAVTASNYGTVGGNGQVVTGSTTDTISGITYEADTGTAARRIACQLSFPKKVT